MSRFNNILVAVDFSQTADDALGVAAEMSGIYRARVHNPCRARLSPLARRLIRPTPSVPLKELP